MISRWESERMGMTEIEARGKIKYRIANEMRKYGENKEEFEDLEIALQVMKEIREYRELGTVEELKDLKEKNEPKKPRFYAHNYHCTECGILVGNNEFQWQRFLYCDNCGQKLDWKGGAE